MKKHSIRILYILVCLLLVLVAMPAGASAASPDGLDLALLTNESNMYTQNSDNGDGNGVWDYSEPLECNHSEHDLQGNCVDCGTWVGHNYLENACACGKTVDLITVYFVNSRHWYDIKIHYWGSELGSTQWPGESMSFSYSFCDSRVDLLFGDIEVYEYKIPADVEGFRINSQEGYGYGEQHQTPDITDGFFDGVAYRMVGPDGNQIETVIMDQLTCFHWNHERDGLCPDCGAENAHWGYYPCGDYTCTVCGLQCPGTGWHVYDNDCGTYCWACGQETRTDPPGEHCLNDGRQLCQGGWCVECWAEVPPQDHVEEIIARVYPGCVEPGWTEGLMCLACNEILIYPEEIPPVGHARRPIGEIAPDCTNPGWTLGYECPVCNDILVYPEEIPAKGHTEMIVWGTEPGCTYYGQTDSVQCAVCYAELVPPQHIPPKGHSFVGGICRDCGEKDIDYVAPIKVDGLNCTYTTRESFTLAWKAVEGSSKYWICINGVPYASTTMNTYAVHNCKLATTYSVSVIAKLTDGTVLALEDADVISVTTKGYEVPCAVSAGISDISINWDTESATKAWLYWGTDAKDLKMYGSSTDGQFLKSGLKPGTTYFCRFVYLVDEKMVNGEIMEITTQVDDSLNVTLDGNALSWNAVEDSDKYWVTVGVGGKNYVYKTTETTFDLSRFTAEQLANATISVRGYGTNVGMYEYNSI